MRGDTVVRFPARGRRRVRDLDHPVFRPPGDMDVEVCSAECIDRAALQAETVDDLRAERDRLAAENGRLLALLEKLADRL